MIELNNVSLFYPLLDYTSHSLQLELCRKVSRVVGGSINTKDNVAYVQALKDINLKICEGQRIGIIGHNGAGKTTLLRVLAGIYPPTHGSIKIQGTVHSLTDFTLGMDMNATGLKNIVFRLVFMGYTFKQAKGAIDEIVEFSELGSFVHLPVRSYSTGMLMRLAFAISTHFIPDILILDEMIGAGDESFQRKAKERIENLLARSNIVILSSHSIHNIKEYCNMCLLMNKGQIQNIGTTEDVINSYMDNIHVLTA